MAISKHFLLVIIFLTFSCKREGGNIGENVSKFSDTDFENSKLSKGAIIDSITQKLKSPGVLFLFRDYLLITDTKSAESIHVINTNNNEYVGNYGKKGEGPGEVMVPWNLSRYDDDTFLLLDVAQRKVLGFNIDSLVSNNTSQFENKFNQNSRSMSAEVHENRIYYTDETNPENRLFSMSLSSDSVDYKNYGQVPVYTKNGETKNITAEAASVIFKSKNGIFVFAYRLAPRIDIFSLKNKEWKSIISPKNFSPKYKAVKEEGESYFALTEETLETYIDLTISEKYIYALYSENKVLDNVYPQGNVIYVFNYLGTPIKKYTLSQNISSFDVKNDSILYGLNVDVLPQIVKLYLN